MILVLALLLAADAGAPPPAGALTTIQRLARAQAPRAKSPWVKAWLAAAQQLPPVAQRTFFCDQARTRCLSEQGATALPEGQRTGLVRKDVGEDVFYARITDPLGYLRAFELLAEHGFDARGRRLVDFGYGNIGQLAMLARIGADATGIEVDPLLPLLYADTAALRGTGKLRVLHGFFPKEARLVKDLGGGYDLFLSKNTLKRGYVHPEKPVPDKQRIDLGVTDQAFVKTVYELLNPGGLFFIYNLSPAPASEGQPYQPWSDGRCPFARETLVQAGFEVLAYDVVDDGPARVMGRALEWDKDPESPTDLEKDLFAHYTLARRPAAKR